MSGIFLESPKLIYVELFNVWTTLLALKESYTSFMLLTVLLVHIFLILHNINLLTMSSSSLSPYNILCAQQ